MRLRYNVPWVTSFALGGAVLAIAQISPTAAATLFRLVAPVIVPVAFVSTIALMFLDPVPSTAYPRCRKAFHTGPRYGNRFTKHCLWCDLKLNGSNAEDLWSTRVLNGRADRHQKSGDILYTLLAGLRSSNPRSALVDVSEQRAAIHDVPGPVIDLLERDVQSAQGVTEEGLPVRG